MSSEFTSRVNLQNSEQNIPSRDAFVSVELSAGVELEAEELEYDIPRVSAIRCKIKQLLRDKNHAVWKTAQSKHPQKQTSMNSTQALKG